MPLLLDVLAGLFGISASAVRIFRCRSRLDEHPTEERSLSASESSS